MAKKIFPFDDRLKSSASRNNFVFIKAFCLHATNVIYMGGFYMTSGAPCVGCTWLACKTHVYNIAQGCRSSPSFDKWKKKSCGLSMFELHSQWIIDACTIFIPQSDNCRNHIEYKNTGIYMCSVSLKSNIYIRDINNVIYVSVVYWTLNTSQGPSIGQGVTVLTIENLNYLRMLASYM